MAVMHQTVNECRGHDLIVNLSLIARSASRDSGESARIRGQWQDCVTMMTRRPPS